MHITSVLAAIVFALSLSTLGCAAGPPSEDPAQASEHDLAEVRSVQLRVLRSSPERLSITVEAIAPTPGFSRLRLRPFHYIQAPPDGIYDYTAVGTPPATNVPAVTAPVGFTETFPLTGSLKGVRVHAQSSSVTALIQGASTPR